MLDKLKSKNKSSEYKSKKLWKFYSVILVIILGFIIIAAKLFKVQVLEREEYALRAEKQHQTQLTLAAERGNIYDRNGQILATTIKTITIAIDPKVLEDKKSVTKELAEIVGLNQNEILAKINKSKRSFVKLASGIDYELITKLKAIQDKGLILIEEPKRSLPYGNIGVQIIGITNFLNKGQSGIELIYDTLLNGKNGFLKTYRDAFGHLRVSADHPIVSAIHGNSIQLSIDIDIQRIVEHELLAGMERSGAEAGTVIVVKPQTGEIISMASYPTFDPKNINKSSVEGMRNRGITDIFEPGSTFKMITAASAMQEGLIETNTMVDGLGGVAKFKGYTIRDVHGIGRVPFKKAMEQSSNIVFANLANRIEDNKFYSYLRNFGFGILTGIDFPGEVKGSIPKPANFHHGSKRYMGHGYGLSSTALQMVNSYATLANNGVMMKPYFLKKIFNNKGSVVQEFRPETIRRVITDTIARKVTDLLVAVVDSGSGKAARIRGMRVAGKTGTSQQLVNGVYSKQNYNASFVGFYPAEDPQVAVIVVVDRPKFSIYGGANSAPIFRDIAVRIMNMYPSFSKYRIKESEINTNSDSVIRKVDSVFVPAISGMKVVDAINELSILGLKLGSHTNAGFVFEQYPKEGEKVPVGTRVDVTIKGSSENLSNNNDINSNKNSETNSEQNKPKIIKHNVIGLSIRRAISILQKDGILTKINGKGIVKSQNWSMDKNGFQVCLLICN